MFLVSIWAIRIIYNQSFLLLCDSAIASIIYVTFNCDNFVMIIRLIIDVTVLNTCFEYWFIADFGNEVKEEKKIVWMHL